MLPPTPEEGDRELSSDRQGNAACNSPKVNSPGPLFPTGPFNPGSAAPSRGCTPCFRPTRGFASLQTYIPKGYKDTEVPLCHGNSSVPQGRAPLPCPTIESERSPVTRSATRLSPQPGAARRRVPQSCSLQDYPHRLGRAHEDLALSAEDTSPSSPR
jgi:hypothetical protein